MQFFRKIAAGLVKHDIDEFVGEEGNIFFGIDTGEFRLSDGITPGGIRLGQGGGSGFTLLPARSDRLGGVKIGDNIAVGLDGTISVAAPFSGNYNDLQNLPNLSQFQLKASAFSGNYNDLTNKPDIPVVPRGLTSFVNDVGYLLSTDLNRIAFTGNYNDLTNKPTIPIVPVALSQFQNDTNFITLSSITWSNLAGKPRFADVATSGNYNDLTNKPTIPTVPTNLSAFNNDTNYLNFNDLTWNNITGKPTWSEVAWSGSFNDLRDKPFIPSDITDLTDKTGLIRVLLPDYGTNAGKVLATDGTGLYWTTMTGGSNITDISQLTDTNGLLQSRINFDQMTTSINPANDATYSLGTADRRWNNLWIKGIKFNTNIAINTANNALVITSPNGIVLSGNGAITFPDGSTISSANGLNASVNLALKGSVGLGSLTNYGTLTFSSNNGVLTTVSGSTVAIDTPQDLRTTASPSFNAVTTGTVSATTVNVGAGGIHFADGTTQTTAGGSAGGGTATGVIKTFNIIGSFAAPVPGTAVFVPFNDTTIRSLQLTNSQMVFNQLQVGLYKNGLLVGTYSIVPGNLTAKYTALDIPLTTQDQLTVSVLTGSGNNFSMAISSSF